MQLSLLQRMSLKRLRLPDAAKQVWLREVSDLIYPNPADPAVWRAFVDASVCLAKPCLPTEVAEALAGFFAAEGPDALLIENLPVDPQLPPPPSDGKRPASKTAISESVIAGLIEQHAAIVTYSNEKAGAPIPPDEASL